MNKFGKTILFIIIFLVFLFIFSITFIFKNEDLIEEFKYEKIELGSFEIKQNNSGSFIKEKITTNKNNTVILNNITKSSRFFSVNGSYTKLFSGKEKIIKLTNGIFLFDINEPGNDVIIQGSGFKIKNKGAGSFFINYNNPNKILIFSIDILMDIEIIEENTQEKVTNILLYPHSYFYLNPSRNSLIKNGDSLKFSQIFNIAFFNQKIFPNGKINDDIAKILTINDESLYNYINEIINYKKKEFINNSTEINNISYNFPGKDIIKKYYYLFFNKEKKQLYYKNTIFENIISLYNLKQINNNLIDEINNNLIELKKINIQEYNNIKDIIEYLYFRNLYSNNNNYIKNINLLNLTLKIENEVKIKNNSLLFLRNIFKNYDFINNYNFFQDILSFKNLYFDDLGINKEKDIKINEIDYLINFLENILNSEIEEKYIEKNITLFNDYIDILINIKNNTTNNNKKIIYKINIVLRNLGGKIFSNYFEKERKENLLIRKKTINKTILNNFNSSIKSLNSYFNNDLVNNIGNDESNEILIKNFKKNINIINEYIIALEDNEKYIKEYNETVKDLIGGNATITRNSLFIDNTDKLILYLSSFNQVTINSTIEEKDSNYCKENNASLNNYDPNFVMDCFYINELTINGYYKISLKFFPYEENKIEVIQKINEKEIVKTYKLDEMKKELDEKIKGIEKEEEKKKYDFKNFFINTFIPKDKNNVVEENNSDEENNNIGEEEKYIKAFKLNLLGDYGYFSLLRGFIDIKYNELDVNKVNNVITVKNSKLTHSIREGNENTLYNGSFNGTFISNDINNFENITLFLYEVEENKDIHILGENIIIFNGAININDIKDKINNLIYQVSNLKNLYKIIEDTLNISIYNKIIYNVEENNIELNFTYKNRIINITYKGGEVIKINYSGRELITDSINIYETTKILNTIK